MLDAIQTIRQKLPFLLNVTPEERRTLPRMGDKSRAFVTQALAVAEQNEEMLPRSFDVREMRKDVELAQALEPVQTALAQLLELVEDTALAVGSEAYTAGLVVYQSAKQSDKSAALDSALDELGRRFARKAGGKQTKAGGDQSA
ncbi:MAG TPA: hypothetical protein VF546_00655 [Pyrinomonadaceae bacterium]